MLGIPQILIKTGLQECQNVGWGAHIVTRSFKATGLASLTVEN